MSPTINAVTFNKQLLGTPKWSEILLSGTSKWCDFFWGEHSNGVRFGCQGHQNRGKCQS